MYISKYLLCNYIYRLTATLTLCSICLNHNPILSLTYHRIFIKSNTTDATSGAGTVYPSSVRTHEFTSVFSGVRVSQSLVSVQYCVDHFLFLFVPVSLDIVLVYSIFSYILVITLTLSQHKLLSKPMCRLLTLMRSVVKKSLKIPKR